MIDKDAFDAWMADPVTKFVFGALADRAKEETQALQDQCLGLLTAAPQEWADAQPRFASNYSAAQQMAALSALTFKDVVPEQEEQA